MSKINKNVVGVFGHGILGRATSAVNFDSQNIPSELYDGFRAVCGLARPVGTTQKRYPWRINQPGTPAQIDVWEKFLYCTRCFGDQTPAQREWWYNQSIGSGLFYYTYFMQETLPYFMQGLLPTWCPGLFSEYFPGTTLDLNKWKEPILSYHPPPEGDSFAEYWVDELFYSRHTGIDYGAVTSLVTRYFQPPVFGNGEVDLMLNWDITSQIENCFVRLSVNPGLVIGLRNTEPVSENVVGFLQKAFVPLEIITDPMPRGVAYRFKVIYNYALDTAKIYVNGALKYDDVIGSSHYPAYLICTHLTNFGGNGDEAESLASIDRIRFW